MSYPEDEELTVNWLDVARVKLWDSASGPRLIFTTESGKQLFGEVAKYGTLKDKVIILPSDLNFALVRSGDRVGLIGITKEKDLYDKTEYPF